MSEGRSALQGAKFDGTAVVEELGLRGMITLRGDLSATKLKNAAKKATGVDVPGPGAANVDGGRGLCWMSPDELLILVPHAEAEATVATIGKALSGTHHLVANVSDARAMFAVSGAGAREVMAKLTPADLHPETFKPGMFRRSRLAQVAAAFWMPAADRFEIVCFRSQAVYVFDLLKQSASAGGEVRYF